MKYRVIKTCFGFRGRLWEEGTVEEIDPSENPPRHFESLEKTPVEPKDSTSEPETQRKLKRK